MSILYFVSIVIIYIWNFMIQINLIKTEKVDFIVFFDGKNITREENKKGKFFLKKEEKTRQVNESNIILNFEVIEEKDFEKNNLTLYENNYIEYESEIHLETEIKNDANKNNFITLENNHSKKYFGNKHKLKNISKRKKIYKNHNKNIQDIFSHPSISVELNNISNVPRINKPCKILFFYIIISKLK